MFKMTDLFNIGAKIIEKFEENNYEAYFVGGAVRDYLIERPINDVDITTNALPEIIESLFDKTIDVGKEHGTIIVLMDDIPFEVTTYRVEGEYSDHRRPDHVNFTQNLNEDLSRRDFTINSLAMTKDRTIFDPFDGQTDLARQLIQTVGIANERFNEDALRMLRAVRFMSQLNFTLSESTKEAIKENAPSLEFVATERITAELVKLYSGVNPAAAKEIIAETKLQNYLPFFNELPTDQYIKTDVSSLENELIVQIFKDQSLEEMISKLKLPNVSKRFVKQTLSLLNALLSFENVKLLAYRYDPDILNHLNDIIKKNKIVGDEHSDHLNKALEEVPQLIIRDMKDLEIDGNTLMKILNVRGGPWIKICLSAIEQEVLFGRLMNTEKELTNWVKTNVKNEDGNIIIINE